MKSMHLYEITTLDGSRYRGEIAYKDDKMIILRMREQSPEQKLRIFYSGIISIREVGWQLGYVPAGQ